MMKRIMRLLAAILICSFSATAHAVVLTFDGNICDGGQPCSDWGNIDQTYGDIAGQLDVIYTSRTGSGNTASQYDYLQWWSNGYSDLTNVAFGGVSDSSGVGEIALIPAAGYEVRLNSFALGAWYQTDRESQVTIFDANWNELANTSTGQITIDGNNSSLFLYHIPPFPTSSNGLIIQWGPSAYNVGIDNVTFTVQRVQGTVVPEPGTWMLLGSGLAGLAAFRKRFARKQ